MSDVEQAGTDRESLLEYRRQANMLIDELESEVDRLVAERDSLRSLSRGLAVRVGELEERGREEDIRLCVAAVARYLNDAPAHVREAFGEVLARTHFPEAVEKDDEGRPYPCGAFVAGDSRWFCRLESDHDGDHEWVQRHSPEEPVGYVVYEKRGRRLCIGRWKRIPAFVRRNPGTYTVHPIGQPLDGEGAET